MKTIRNLIGRALCTWLGLHSYGPVAAEYDQTGRCHRVRECRHCGYKVWRGEVPLPERVRALLRAQEGFSVPEGVDPRAGAENAPAGRTAQSAGAVEGQPVAPASAASLLAAMRANLQAEFGPEQPDEPERPVRPVTDLKGKALGPGVCEHIAKLRRNARPDEVTRQVMAEGVGRTAPLEPRRWATDRGFGPMREW